VKKSKAVPQKYAPFNNEEGYVAKAATKDKKRIPFSRFFPESADKVHIFSTRDFRVSLRYLIQKTCQGSVFQGFSKFSTAPKHSYLDFQQFPQPVDKI
jgi:hypothetical protein